MSLCAHVKASSLDDHWPLGTVPFLSGLVSVGHPGAVNCPPRQLQPHSLCLPAPTAGCVPELPWCQRSSTSVPTRQLGGSERGNHNFWSPGSRALRMLISLCKRVLILPKLTRQHLPKAHVSAGKWKHRLLLTGAPSAGGRARSNGSPSHVGAQISTCP